MTIDGRLKSSKIGLDHLPPVTILHLTAPCRHCGRIAQPVQRRACNRKVVWVEIQAGPLSQNDVRQTLKFAVYSIRLLRTFHRHWD